MSRLTRRDIQTRTPAAWVCVVWDPSLTDPGRAVDVLGPFPDRDEAVAAGNVLRSDLNHGPGVDPSIERFRVLVRPMLPPL